MNKSILAVCMAAVLLVTQGCSKKEPQWEYKLGETVKVQTDLLLVSRQGIVVTWTADETGDGEKEFIIPRVHTVKDGIHMSARKGGFGACLVALDLETGREVWRSEYLGQSDQNTSSPVCFGDRIYVGSDAGLMHEIDAATGKVLRSYDNDVWIHLRPVVTEKYLIFADEEGMISIMDRESMSLIKKIRSSYTHIDPLLTGGLLIYSSEASVIKYDMRGNELGRFVSRDKYTDFSGIERRGAGVRTGITTDGESIYFATEGGFIHKVSVDEMKDVWVAHVDGLTDSFPFHHEGQLFFGTMDGMVSIDTGDGTILHAYGTDNRWMDYKLKFRKGGAVRGGFAVDGNTVFFGSRDYALYGYDIISKKRVFKFAIKNKIGKTSPLIGGDIVVFGADSRKLYAVKIDGR